MVNQHGAMLHGEADRQRTKARIARVLVVLGILTLVAAAGVTASLIWRDATHMNNPNETPSQIITIAITLVWGVAAIFFWGMKMTPLLSYRKFLRDLDKGLTREVEGVVTEIDADLSFRDGLSFYRLIVNVNDLENPEDERVLYWDAQLGKPDLAVGERIFVVAHGNDMISLEKR